VPVSLCSFYIFSLVRVAFTGCLVYSTLQTRRSWEVLLNSKFVLLAGVCGVVGWPRPIPGPCCDPPETGRRSSLKPARRAQRVRAATRGGRRVGAPYTPARRRETGKRVEMPGPGRRPGLGEPDGPVVREFPPWLALRSGEESGAPAGWSGLL